MHNNRIINYLNITIFSTLGVCIGLTLYLYLDSRANPGLYALQSAPWYTNAIIPGIVDIAIILVCIAVKLVLKKRKII